MDTIFYIKCQCQITFLHEKNRTIYYSLLYYSLVSFSNCLSHIPLPLLFLFYSLLVLKYLCILFVRVFTFSLSFQCLGRNTCFLQLAVNPLLLNIFLRRIITQTSVFATFLDAIDLGFTFLGCFNWLFDWTFFLSTNQPRPTGRLFYKGVIIIEV